MRRQDDAGSLGRGTEEAPGAREARTPRVGTKECNSVPSPMCTAAGMGDRSAGPGSPLHVR